MLTNAARQAPAAAGRVRGGAALRGFTLMEMLVVLVITSLALILLILLHRGKGGGLSDMFGGGMSSSLGGSSVAERNLDRITISVAVVWFTCIVGLGILDRFA